MFPNQVPEDHKKEKEKKTAASKDTAQKEKWEANKVWNKVRL